MGWGAGVGAIINTLHIRIEVLEDNRWENIKYNKSKERNDNKLDFITSLKYINSKKILLRLKLIFKKEYVYRKLNFRVHACHFLLFPRKNKVPFK